MKKIFVNLSLLALALFVLSCIEETDTENEKPKLEILSPLPCDTLYFGQFFQYKARITDNTGLGNLSMDIHHNFGHHDHGVHETCSMDEPKEAVNPYFRDWLFSLPGEKMEFILDTLLYLPAVDELDSLQLDTGDYHFHIYVTDNDGYQVFSTMDVKVLYD